METISDIHGLYLFPGYPFSGSYWTMYFNKLKGKKEKKRYETGNQNLIQGQDVKNSWNFCKGESQDDSYAPVEQI